MANRVASGLFSMECNMPTNEIATAQGEFTSDLDQKTLGMIQRKLKVFCFGDTEITSIEHLSGIYYFACVDYLVYVTNPLLGKGIIKVRIINNLYCEARVIQGFAWRCYRSTNYKLTRR